MAKQTVLSKKRRGPPATGKGTLIGVRLQPAQLSALDAWIRKQEGRLTRPQAIRQLVELGLAAAPPTRQRSPNAAARAAEMAGERIDKLANPSLPQEEQQTRKRRLIKGPQEFREMRDARKRKS